jgi:hypothetical protein
MKRVAVVQSNYIPWKGYFDLIAAVDEFILYDDMQYTRRDWRNRNLIKTPQGLQWLTVPVKVKGRYTQRIRDTEVDGIQWAESHWKALAQNYRRAACFDEVASWLEPMYRERAPRFTHLSALNRALIEAVCARLGICTRISNSWDYSLADGKSERLADLCTQAGATAYVSGPSARNYLERQPFDERGIEVVWFDYEGYAEYRQQWGAFVHGVSVVDLLFNEGAGARDYLRFATKAGARGG